jgi:hypothetical protein
MRARRLIRNPAVLMAAYAGVFIAIGPWFVIGPGHAQRDVLEIGIAAFLAWRVASGGATARGILIGYTILGMAAVLISASTADGSWARLGLLAAALVQLALLVSTPVWARTRPEGRPGPPAAPLWPPLRLRTLFAGIGAGLILTLLPVGATRLQPILSCPALPGLVPAREQAHAHCQQTVSGLPVAYRNWGIGNEDLPGGRSIGLVLRPGLRPSSFAIDWLLWGLAAFSVAYLVGVSGDRERSYHSARPPEPGRPAS